MCVKKEVVDLLNLGSYYIQVGLDSGPLCVCLTASIENKTFMFIYSLRYYKKE